MSDQQHQPSTVEAPEPEGPKRIAAARDAAFVRVIADVSFANVIGREIDVALLLRQTVYRDILMGDEEQPAEVKGAKTLIEVGRLRMPADSATYLAFNILYACATEDMYLVEDFDTNVQRIRDAIQEADSGDRTTDAE